MGLHYQYSGTEMHLLCVCVYYYFFAASISSAFDLRSTDVYCRDTFLGGTLRSAKDRKFLVAGRFIEDNTGLGNTLIFFPAMYYFATFTNRDIVIYDQTAIGAMCQVIHCGFPLVSQLVNVHPEELKWAEVTFLRRINWKMFDNHMSGLANVTEVQVGPYGFQSKSDWWAYNPVLKKCVADVTGCAIGDVTCSERHALQRLLVGPFLPNASSVIQSQMIGFPDIFKRGISTVQHNYMPRIDLSLHIRNQFYHFENGNRNGSDHEYIKEAEQWLDTTEAKLMIKMLKEKIVNIITVTRPELAAKGTYISNNRNSSSGSSSSGDKSNTSKNRRRHLRADDMIGRIGKGKQEKDTAGASSATKALNDLSSSPSSSSSSSLSVRSDAAPTSSRSGAGKEAAAHMRGDSSRSTSTRQRRRLKSHGSPPPMIYENAAARESELRQGSVQSMYDNFYIYVAADNEVVKKNLFNILGQAPEFEGMNVKMLMKESDVQVHSKFIVAKATSKDLEVMRRPMIDLTFDLYVMSLSNNLIAYRKGNSLSTFVSAAQRVSGTRERTDAQTWSGIGTRGYHLKTTNPPRFEAFPVYPNF